MSSVYVVTTYATMRGNAPGSFFHLWVGLALSKARYVEAVRSTDSGGGLNCWLLGP